MSEPASSVALVVVPGFHGYVPADGAPAGRAAERLVDLWLGLVEGLDRPEHFDVMTARQGVITREFPPDPSLEPLLLALRDRQERGDLYCFSYDWRLDLTASASRLAAELQELARTLGIEAFDILAHGPGGLLARYLVESRGLRHAGRLVRRLVLVGAPSHGIPVSLELLQRLFESFEPGPAFRTVLDEFPSCFQLLPPRGTSYVRAEGAPGIRIEPFSWPQAFLAARAQPAGTQATLASAVVREAAGRNEALHGQLAHAYHPAWRELLMVVSAAVPSPGAVRLRVGGPDGTWKSAGTVLVPGDGLVPIIGAVPHPRIRHLLVEARHRELLGNREALEQIGQFLSGPVG